MRKLKEVVTDPESSVADISKQLDDALEDAEHASHVSAARAAVFGSANAPKEKPQPYTMARIIEYQMGDGQDDTLVQDMRELEELLDSSEMTGRQANALEQAEKRARKAMHLLIRFREMYRSWEMDNSVIFGSLTYEATRQLQREKDQKKRSKQITDADVESMVAEMFPDEWRAQERKRLRAKQTEKSLEHLVEVWGFKCRSLQSLVGKGR